MRTRIDLVKEFPRDVLEIFKALTINNVESYIVGGAVRDTLLNRPVKDYDFATILHPEKVMEIFKEKGYEVLPTGIDYGTVTVMLNKTPYEITTFRLDVEYLDGRRPNVVKYADSIDEDLARRDFTINAMAVDCFGNIIDKHNGMRDLENSLINTVDHPKYRFGEDKLRILRGIRFASRYGFTLDPRTEWAMFNQDISNLSQERITSEFNKIITCEKPSKWLKFMYNTNLLQQIIPELNDVYECAQYTPYHDKNVWGHTLMVVDHVEPKLELRLAALFHDIGKPITKSTGEDGIDHFYKHHVDSNRIARKVMKRMTYSNKMIEYVCELVYFHMSNQYDKITSNIARRFINKVGQEHLDDLFKLMIADRIGAVTKFEDLEKIFTLKFACEKALNEKQAVNVKQLNINGHELIELGIEQGKQIGVMLNLLLEMTLDYPWINSNPELSHIVLDFLECGEVTINEDSEKKTFKYSNKV